MIAEGRNINVTLIFSLDRYAGGDGGLHRRARGATPQTPGADLSQVASVASFFISRVDTEVDRRLDAIGIARGAGAARQGRRRPGQARLPAVPADVQRAALGGARRRGRRGAAPAVGEHVDQEPGLPRHAVRRRADRAGHGQHAARRARSRRSPTTARSPAASTPTSTRPTRVWQGLADVGVDMDDVAAQARARGRRQLPEELRRAARRARGQGRRAAQPAETAAPVDVLRRRPGTRSCGIPARRRVPRSWAARAAVRRHRRRRALARCACRAWL